MAKRLPKDSPGSHIPISSRKRKQIKRMKFNRSISRRKKNIPSTSSFCKIQESLDVPWKKRDSYSGILGLHDEINDFYEFLAPTTQESELRLRVVEHITNVVHSRWPKATVEVFGSYRTKLYLPDGDVDLVITGLWRSLPLYTLCAALVESGIRRDDIQAIPDTAVPIVRIIHTHARVKVDISFNLRNGVQGSKLIRKYIKAFPALPKLVFVLKQFLGNRNLNDAYTGGMRSYCLTLLLINFLQGFHKPECPKSTNLGTILIEFFELYGVNFNHSKVAIHFKDGLPSLVPLQAGFPPLNDPTRENQSVPWRNNLFPCIKSAFEHAYHKLHDAVTETVAPQKYNGSILRRLLFVEKEVLQKREWTYQNYHKILRIMSASHRRNNFLEL